ncbi:unnamed protein product [Linum tenue]|nr:unnamed protein product [Linum tenue]CAI0388985.1 unnamed protein product [Linum tenue]
MKAMARCVGLEEDCFLKQYGGKEMMMSRFNHYPVCPRPDVVLGVKAHSDGSGVTVLLQDDKVEGLQILKEGRWYGVPIIPHALVVNVGDQMQVCSLMNHNRRLLFEIKLTCGVEFGELGLYGILIRD